MGRLATAPCGRRTTSGPCSMTADEVASSPMQRCLSRGPWEVPRRLRKGSPTGSPSGMCCAGSRVPEWTYWWPPTAATFGAGWRSWGLTTSMFALTPVSWRCRGTPSSLSRDELLVLGDSGIRLFITSLDVGLELFPFYPPRALPAHLDGPDLTATHECTHGGHRDLKDLSDVSQ